MLKIRLQRVGRRNNPQFRVVLTESRNAADGGKFQEVLGSYNPHANTAQLKTDRISHWISQGVQPSDTVHNLLVREGVVEGKKVNVLPKKRPIVKEKAEEESSSAPAQETSADGGASSGEPAATEETKEASESDSSDETPSEQTDTNEDKADDGQAAEAQGDGSKQADASEESAEAEEEEK